MARRREKKKKDKDPGGLFFVGSLFVGLGIGMYFGRPDVGVLTGLGVGFILMGLYYLLKKK